MARLGNTIHSTLDNNTGENVTWNKVTTYSDGTSMSDAKCDGVIYRKSGTEYFRRNFTGHVNAAWYGIVGDGTDKTAALNSLLAKSHVTSVEFSSIDKPNITILGTLTTTKKLIFRNKNRFIGTGTITGSFFVDCSPLDECFASTLTSVSNCLLNNQIEVMWFGAKADMTLGGSTSGVTNNTPLFKRALDSAQTATTTPAYNYRKKLHIPGCPTDKCYYMDSTWNIDAEVEIFGDGFQQTILRVKSGIVGVHVLFPDFITPVAGAHEPFLHDFRVTSTNGVGDGVSHGFLIEASGFYERLWADFFLGDGFKFRGNSPGTNVSTSRVMDCRGRNNSGSGLKIEGADSQVMQIIGGDYSYNGRYGVWDRGFLGNFAAGIHTDGNGHYFDFNRGAIAHFSTTKGWWVKFYVRQSVITKVSHNGTRYHCILDHQATTLSEPGVGANWTTYWASDGAGGQNDSYMFWEDQEFYRTTTVEPEVTTGWENYYTFVEDITSATNPSSGLGPAYDSELPNLNVGYWRRWDASVAWLAGGSYFFDGSNQQGVYSGCYFEQDQNFPRNTASTIVLGGFAGNKGVGAGAIGFNYPHILMEGLQVKNAQADKGTGFRITPVTDPATSVGTEIQYFDDVHTRVWRVYIHTNGLWEQGPASGNALMQIISPTGITAYRDRMNLDAIPGEGALTFPNGFYLGRNKSQTALRYFGSATAAPTTGYHAEAEILINSNENSTAVAYWKNLAAANTWAAIGQSEFVLTSAANITIDSRRASTFVVVAGHNIHFEAPTFPEPGKRITIRHKQDGTGSRIPTWDSIFRAFGASIPGGSTLAGYIDYYHFEYNAADDRWDMIHTLFGIH